MRVSTSQIYSSGLDLMKDVQTSLNDVQKQVSTGVKLTKPSDDPIAFSQSLKLVEEISINQQFSDNIRSARGRNELSDSMLDSGIKVLQRMRELGVQASNDTLNSTDRAGIGEEIRILQNELAGIMNARDGSGEYIFAGFQGRNEPFVERSGGGYDYTGDEGQRIAQISPSSYIELSDSGKDLFVDIPAARNTILTRASPNNDPAGESVINVGQIFDQAALDQVYPEKFYIEFGDPEQNQNRRTYTVRRVGDGAPVVGTSPVGSLENITYVPGESIEFHGVRVEVGGDPQAGDVFFVESSGNQSTMNTVERYALALESLSINPVVLEGTASLIGRAAPPRPTLTSAGNYVAEQTLRVLGDDGSIQALQVASNESVGTIAAALDAFTGISASFNEAQATLDFTTSSADEGDIIQFNVNGIAVQATAGATATQTYNNLDAALGAVLPTASVSYSNEGSGQFIVTENTGEDVTIDSFEVVEFPGVELNVTSGLLPGETIGLTLTGSGGDVVNVSYVAAAGGIDELTTQIQTAITGAGLGAVMSVSQTGAGQPAVLRYSGDTDGDAQIALSGLTDNATDDIVLSLVPLAGTDSTDNITNGAVTTLRSGSQVNVIAQEGRGTMGVQGSIGDMVTLSDGGNDSTAVAAELNYDLQTGFGLESSALDRNGGLVYSPTLEDTVTLQFRDAMNSSLENLDNALDNLTRARSRMGARLNMLETAKDANEGMNVELQDFLSRIRDLDYAEALTEVQMKSFILQSAQSTFVKMTGLSLFNFL